LENKSRKGRGPGRRSWSQISLSQIALYLQISDNRIAKIARDGKPHSGRPPGRPPKRWRDSWMST